MTSRILLVCKEIQARRQTGVEVVEGRGYEPCEAASHIGVRPYIIALLFIAKVRTTLKVNFFLTNILQRKMKYMITLG